MTDITPDPVTVVADPSDPRWTPPPGNTVDVDTPDTATPGEVGQG